MSRLMISAIIVLFFDVSSAFAQADINLSAELPGKTCLGTFTVPNPKGYDTDQGAVRVAFKDGTAFVQVASGIPAYRAPADAKFPDATPVVTLQLTANAVAFARKTSDWKYKAVRREGSAIILSGEADPRRGNPTWIVGMASLNCQ